MIMRFVGRGAPRHGLTRDAKSNQWGEVIAYSFQHSIDSWRLSHPRVLAIFSAFLGTSARSRTRITTRKRSNKRSRRKIVDPNATTSRSQRYKRKQAAPGLNVTSRAFGVGRRLPIALKYVD